MSPSAAEPSHGAETPPGHAAVGSPPAGSPAVDEDGPAPVTARQLLRWVTVIGALVVTVLACWQDPGYAICTGG